MRPVIIASILTFGRPVEIATESGRSISWIFSHLNDRFREAMTIPRIQELAAGYIRPDRMIYLAIGDAESQLELLKQLGLGYLIRLNRSRSLQAVFSI